MSFDSDAATLASEDIIDALGQEATYFPGDGARNTVTIVFDKVPNFIEGDSGEYQTFDASFSGKTSELYDIVEGRIIEIDTISYTIAVVEPDTGGVTTCRLYRA